MKRNLKLFVVLVMSLLVMVACNNGDTTSEDNGDSMNESSSETDQTENDDIVEDSNVELGEKEGTDLSGDESEDDIEYLTFGETGIIEDTLGTYEVTPKSFRFTDSLGEASEKETPYNDIFVVVEIDIKNIGSEILNLEDITKAELFSDTRAGGTGFSNYPEIIQFIGEIKPAENFVGHIVFDVSERDYYEMSFGFGMPSHISNEIRWVLPMEDVE